MALEALASRCLAKLPSRPGERREIARILRELLALEPWSRDDAERGRREHSRIAQAERG